ncbi:MAG: AlkZ family DNA glycosylase [Anaerolineae bacterium]|nr:AlkZ family DNA glycosylase [Anaerolineae bacterium]
MMTTATLTWPQVNAWRLAQQRLTTRLGRENFAHAVTHVVGVQAQVMSAAELALWARADSLTPGDVQSALWSERTLIKTWAMRGTLHLLSAEELPLFCAARAGRDLFGWPRYFAYYGVNKSQFEAYLDVAPQVLSTEPMTREQFATAVAERTGAPELRELILSKGWGTPLKPLASSGHLCFGPSQGQNVTFVNGRQWIGKWETIDPDEAQHEIVRRFLRAFGPAIPHDFTRWWWGGTGIPEAKALFAAIDDELEPVEVAGKRAFVLRETLEPMQQIDAAETVNLLPMFDVYTLGLGRDTEPFLPAAYRKRVYRAQGWISAVVLVGGNIKGVWEYKIRRGRAAVSVSLFAKTTKALTRGIEGDVERLGAFLNLPVEMTVEVEA